MTHHILMGYYLDEDKIYHIKDLVDITKDNMIIVVPVEQFEHLLEHKIWENEDGNRIKPSQVISTKTPTSHYQRILDADLNYPILIRRTPQNELVICDGYHRLCKAKMTHITFINAKYINDEQFNKLNHLTSFN